MAIRTYKDLDVYRESYEGALEVSRISRTFPVNEQSEIARQLRRSARSIPANIAEGWAKRNSAAEFKRYLQMAFGSCQETFVWLDMSRDEGFLSKENHEKLAGRYTRISVMLQNLWRNWRTFKGRGTS